MPRQSKFSAEQRRQILQEYGEAASARTGGGAEVAKKYEVSASTIASWRQTEAKPNGVRRRAAPVQEFASAIDRLIAYHEAQIAKLQKIREGYEA